MRSERTTAVRVVLAVMLAGPGLPGCRSAVNDFYAPLTELQACSGGGAGTGGKAGGEAGSAGAGGGGEGGQEVCPQR